MSRINFKISLIAAGVMAATSSQAALYKVVEVAPTDSSYEKGVANGVDVTEFYGSAIGKERKTTGSLGCFGQSCNSVAYTLLSESRTGSEGHSFKQEVAFNYDTSFYYRDWTRNRDYCRNELGYQTCDPGWADKLWFSYSDHGGLQRQKEAWKNNNYKSTAQSFIDGGLLLANTLPETNNPDGFNSPISASANTVINQISEDGADVKAIGNTSSGHFTNGTNAARTYLNRGFVGDASGISVLEPMQDSFIIPYKAENTANELAVVRRMGMTMAFDSFEYDDTNSGTGTKYVVGSAAVTPFAYTDGDKSYGGESLENCVTGGYSDPASQFNCQNFGYATKAAIWKVDGAGSLQAVPVSPWRNSGNNGNVATPNVDNKRAMQGSVRGAVISNQAGILQGKPVLVGFNSYQDGNNVFMQATVFKSSSVTNANIMNGDSWEPSIISRATIKDGDDFVYSNSVATDINKNLVVIGEAKRRGDKRENGAAPNRMFLTSIDSSGNVGSAQYFDELNGNSGIFFRGVGGETGAINNFNEIVGAVDAEQSTEYFGKKRRQRGFIYPYNVADSSDQEMIDRRAIFQNRPWLLDDLTNGGSESTNNNQFRIVDAVDINDDGVIIATALKCEGGYDTTGHNSYCGSGQKREKVVAVKLIPIANATSADIQTRALEAAPVERKGGSLGWMAMIFLGFLGLRRNK
ncbi:MULTISPECIES: DUF3466 family protein [Vibrio]|uniref:DUF3466 family protein n=1 Tax=Vibrio mediterranei TaxID=689 RepID=A0A3G4V5A1_9VIBR|nr:MULTISPECIES: DUF3466 family protein [Vibrio]AYV19870.1 DUF3466 family protein [Vibrio mediterranei]MDA0109803.1 DUF3466 family protein [Vibrio sp. La 4.2.2]